MEPKQKIKTKTRPVSMYLTDEEHKRLVEVTNKEEVSLTEWMRDAMEIKLRRSSDELMKESDRLIAYWEKRIEELKAIPEPDVLDKLYLKTANHKLQK